MNTKEIKWRFGHNLVRSYNKLPNQNKILTKDELNLLKNTSEIYNSKRFEYFCVIDAVHGFADYPDIEELAALAKKIVESI